MKTEPVCILIVLSDWVVCEQGTRKNSLIGSFHNFNSPRFPFPTPPFFITVAITNLDPEVKEYNLCVRIEDPKDSSVLANVSGSIKFGEEAKFLKENVFEISFPVMPFIISKPGFYKILVLVNTEVAGQRLLTVNAVSVSAAPQQ